MRRRRARRPVRKLTTIGDVARAAGVGLATASRALTASGYASAAARTRVLEAARRLGYVPSQAARALGGGHRRAIGVVLPDLGIPVYVKWLRAAEDQARRHGYILLVCDARRSDDVARAQLQWLLEERVAGVLLAGHVGAEDALASLEAAGIPIVPPLPANPRRKGPRDDAERPATLQAFRHLVSRGHRRIAYLSVAQHGHARTSPLGRLRLACLRTALEEAGGHVDPRLIVTVDRADMCADETSRLLQDAKPPTAFVAASGDVTAPVLRALADAGRSVPGDASVLAFGESEWEAAYRPPISVVRHDYEGVAAARTRQLIGRIQRRKDTPEAPPFPSEFVDRGSIGPRAAVARR